MDNLWLERRMICFAHQAGAREGPSSTLAGIDAALGAGAHVIELDVHATEDGELVVCHDATVDSTTNGRGAIAAQRLEQLNELDAAYWFVPGEGAVPWAAEERYVARGRARSDPRYRFPSLAQVLEAFPGVPLNLDIKQTAPQVAPYEEELARLLVDYGRGEEVIVTSFYDRATENFTRLAPQISTSAGTNALVGFIQAVRAGAQPDPSIRRHAALQVPVYYQQTRVVDRQLIDAAHRAGLAIHAWTIDDELEMERLVDDGVDGIMSDVPSVLTGVLSRLGVRYPEQFRAPAA